MAKNRVVTPYISGMQVSNLPSASAKMRDVSILVDSTSFQLPADLIAKQEMFMLFIETDGRSGTPSKGNCVSHLIKAKELDTNVMDIDITGAALLCKIEYVDITGTYYLITSNTDRVIKSVTAIEDNQSTLVQGLQGPQGVQGIPGFPGTYAEWLTMPGNAGKSYQDFIDVITGPVGSGIAGQNGESAYEIFMRLNPTSTLTEQQWIDSLKGLDGLDGVDGIDGLDGNNGLDADDIWATTPEALAYIPPISTPGLNQEQRYLEYSSPYGFYRRTTTDNPIKTQQQWVDSLQGKSSYAFFVESNNPTNASVDTLPLDNPLHLVKNESDFYDFMTAYGQYQYSIWKSNNDDPKVTDPKWLPADIVTLTAPLPNPGRTVKVLTLDAWLESMESEPVFDAWVRGEFAKPNHGSLVFQAGQPQTIPNIDRDVCFNNFLSALSLGISTTSPIYLDASSNLELRRDESMITGKDAGVKLAAKSLVDIDIYQTTPPAKVEKNNALSIGRVIPAPNAKPNLEGLYVKTDYISETLAKLPANIIPNTATGIPLDSGSFKVLWDAITAGTSGATATSLATAALNQLAGGTGATKANSGITVVGTRLNLNIDTNLEIVNDKLRVVNSDTFATSTPTKGLTRTGVIDGIQTAVGASLTTIPAYNADKPIASSKDILNLYTFIKGNLESNSLTFGASPDFGTSSTSKLNVKLKTANSHLAIDTTASTGGLHVTGIGDLTTLTTTAKTDLVAAINEVNAKPSGGGGTSTTVVDGLTSTSTTSALSANQGKVLNEKIGDITTLTTTAKTNTVVAINELDTSIGDLSTLTTAKKASAVEAINELDKDIGDISTLPNKTTTPTVTKYTSAVDALNTVFSKLGAGDYKEFSNTTNLNTKQSLTVDAGWKDGEVMVRCILATTGSEREQLIPISSKMAKCTFVKVGTDATTVFADEIRWSALTGGTSDRLETNDTTTSIVYARLRY